MEKKFTENYQRSITGANRKKKKNRGSGIPPKKSVRQEMWENWLGKL